MGQGAVKIHARDQILLRERVQLVTSRVRDHNPVGPKSPKSDDHMLVHTANCRITLKENVAIEIRSVYFSPPFR